MNQAINADFDWMLRWFLAGLADHPQQALRENAVERRHEVVDFDLHVEESAEHVDDIVGVHSGEHEVAGQG